MSKDSQTTAGICPHCNGSRNIRNQTHCPECGATVSVVGIKIGVTGTSYKQVLLVISVLVFLIFGLVGVFSVGGISLNFPTE